ncbi:MAG: aldose 1-epimerase family protein [Microthrixaceae bacterium]
MKSFPSGEQFEIGFGDQRATIVEVGGGIREYFVGSRAVLNPYEVDRMCDGAHGAPLIPWPNRLADGKYRFGGVDHQVALTEPAKSNAIHGFLLWRSWSVLDHDGAAVTVGTTIHPLTGYPFSLDVQITYSLDETGLTVTTTATNVGTERCPFGAGQHPYLSPGVGPIDDCTVELDATTRVLTDDERQLPIGVESVDGTDFDFREPKLLGPLAIDHAFTDLARDGDGRAWLRLGGPDGRIAQLWVDEHYRLLQLYTGDTLSPGRRRSGLGSEPMTCPPNAFQSGESLIELQPSEAVVLQWGASLA